MKYLKTFNEKNDTEYSTSDLYDLDKVKKYLEEKYTEGYFDEELENRAPDFIDEEDTEEYEGSYSKAYQNLWTGGAVEYDLLDEITKDIQEKFGLDYDTADEVVITHFKDKCTWYDPFIFDKPNNNPLLDADLG